MGRKVNSKDIHMWTKKHCCIDYVLEKTGCSSIEQLERLMDRLCPEFRDEAIKEFQKNSKNSKRIKRLKNEKKNIPTRNFETKKEEVISEKKGASLHDEGLRVTDEIRSLDTEHKELVKKVAEIRKEAESYIDILNEIKTRIQEIARDKAEREEKLAEISEKIKKEEEKIIVYVYDDSEVDIDGKNIPDFATFEEDISSIINAGDIDNFTVKQLKVLVNLKSFERNIEGREYEIIFESSKMEELYKRL